MPQPHIIRLRGPWELQPLARWQVADDGTLAEIADPLPPGGRLAMPSDWSKLLGPDFHGRVRHLRRFARPTGLDSGERVWLVCDGAADAATIALNGAPLGAIPGTNQPTRFDVTERLLPRNELVIDVDFPSAKTAQQTPTTETNCGGLTGEVQLEIFG
jgi:beta-galactosidase/beta-glucuronidase